MILKQGMLYYLYDEVRDKAIEVLRNEIIRRSELTGSKFIGDITKVSFSRQQIGSCLRNMGYRKKRMQIDKVSKNYYYIDNDI